MKAIAAVQAKQLSINKAADMFGIPRTTLKDKLSGSSALETTQGPDPVLNKTEEEETVEWAKIIARIGNERTKEQRFEILQRFFQKTQGPTHLRMTDLVKRGGRLFYEEILLCH